MVVYEREGVPGGLAAGFPLGESHLEKFYHHLFRSDRDAIALIEELGLGDALVWPRPKTSTLLGGAFHQLDSPATVLRFQPLSLPDRLRLATALAYLKLEPHYERLERTTADRWIRRWMGPAVHRQLWQPLLKSKFGAYADTITASWFWARIHYRSTSLGYLRGGFQRLYDALVAEIRRLGGTIALGTEVRLIEPLASGGFRVVTDRGEETFDRIISTLPIRLLTRLAPTLGPDYAERYGQERYLGAHVLILSLDRPLTDVYWLNINDPGFPFMALVEHTNYMPPENYGGRHLVYLGNYLPMEHPYFGRSAEEMVEEYLPALQRINPDLRRSWITEARVFAAPYAQPIVDVGYRGRIPPHETPLPNLYVANMAQVYPQDRGQNYSIRLANELVRTLPDRR